MLRYLSNCFGTRLVVPEYFIDKLEQNHVIQKCDFYFPIGKIIFGRNLQQTASLHYLKFYTIKNVQMNLSVILFLQSIL